MRWKWNMVLIVFSGKCEKSQAMAPETLNVTQNLNFKTFRKSSSYRLWVYFSLRYLNLCPRQRLAWSKLRRVWTLWRPQRHVLNEFKETVNEKDVAQNMKNKLCHWEIFANDLPASRRSRSRCPPWWRSKPYSNHTPTSVHAYKHAIWSVIWVVHTRRG